MKKEIYLVKGGAKESYQAFSERIALLANELSKENGIKELKYVFTAGLPPKYSVIPFKKEKIAAVSVKYSSEWNRKMLFENPHFADGYRVEEALPVVYEKTWNNGIPTPGVCLLTLFRRKRGIDKETFLHRWHNSHTPLSLEIHPLWNYNRNVVLENFSDKPTPFEGIVEEQFRKKADLINPVIFFGPFYKMIYNMARVYTDTRSFLDYKTIETYFAVEIWIKS